MASGVFPLVRREADLIGAGFWPNWAKRWSNQSYSTHSPPLSSVALQRFSTTNKAALSTNRQRKWR